MNVSDERLAEMIEQAVQAAIDAGLAVNGEYGVAAARHAAKTIAQSLRAQGGVRIKPLEWQERVKGVHRAETIVGDYRVWTHHEADGVVFWQLSDGGVKAAGQGTEAECYAAAQADYERRVLSSLAASPAPVSEPTDEMVDVAHEVIEQSFLTDCWEFGPPSSLARAALRAALVAKGGQ